MHIPNLLTSICNLQVLEAQPLHLKHILKVDHCEVGEDQTCSDPTSSGSALSWTLNEVHSSTWGKGMSVMRILKTMFEIPVL